MHAFLVAQKNSWINNKCLNEERDNLLYYTVKTKCAIFDDLNEEKEICGKLFYARK
jgi:hypothetical protein